MNKTRLKFILGFILFALLVTGCQHRQNETIPTIPGIDTSSEHVNKDIDLILWPQQNIFKIDESVVISVRLQSDIQVNSDFDVKMYALDEKNNSWIEVEDFVDNSGSFPLKHEVFILDKMIPFQ